MENELIVPDVEFVIATESGMRVVQSGDRIPKGSRIMNIRWRTAPPGLPPIREQQPAQAQEQRMWIEGANAGQVLFFIGLVYGLWHYGYGAIAGLGLLLIVLQAITRTTRAEVEKRRRNLDGR